MNIHGTAHIQHKVGWARDAIEHYPAQDNDMRTTIMDLIADLLHLAEDEGLNAVEVLSHATEHFYAEGGAGHEPDVFARDAAVTEE